MHVQLQADTGEFVSIRTPDVGRAWAVVTQTMRGGEVVQREVVDGLGLLEAADLAGSLRSKLEAAGWQGNGKGGHSGGVDGLEVVYIFVDGRGGGEVI